MAIVQLIVSTDVVVIMGGEYDEVTLSLGEFTDEIRQGETYAGKTFDELKALGTGEHELD